MTIKEVELTIPFEFKNEPFFYQIIKNFEIIVNIVEASFSTSTGWTIVKLEGEQQEIQRLFDFLKEKGVQIKER